MANISFKNFTVGVEEEYMVIDPVTRELKSHEQKIVQEGQKILKDKVKAEMHQAVVEVGTDIIWEYTEKFRTPMIFAVNKLDDDKADFDKTVREAKAHFGNKVIVVQYPRQIGAGFHEIIDVLRMRLI